jgi:hypothetical protein
MNASLYFELVDAVARVDGDVGLMAVSERVSATPMHPLERRVLERALRARSEALAIRDQLATSESRSAPSIEVTPLAANG